MSDIMELVERLRARSESYRLGGPSSEHTAALLDEAAFALEPWSDYQDYHDGVVSALVEKLKAHEATIERLVAEMDEARRHLYLVRNDRDNLSDHVHLAESRCERLVDRKCPCRPPSSGEE